MRSLAVLSGLALFLGAGTSESAIRGPASPSARIAAVDEVVCTGNAFTVRDGLQIVGRSRGLDATVFWDLLADDARPNCWMGAVQMIGLTGDATDFGRLVDWLTAETDDDLEAPAHAARARAPWAMGLLAARHPEAAAPIVAFLRDGTRPETWAARGVRFARAGFDADYSRAVLANMSLQGLALTGDAHAVAHLEALQQTDQRRGMVRDALALARRVVEVGYKRALRRDAETHVALR